MLKCIGETRRQFQGNQIRPKVEILQLPIGIGMKALVMLYAQKSLTLISQSEYIKEQYNQQALHKTTLLEDAKVRHKMAGVVQSLGGRAEAVRALAWEKKTV